jgi:hypothetical protein
VQTAAQQYRAIAAEFRKEQQDFFQAYSKANQQERQKLTFPDAQKYAKRMLALAEAHPKDPAAVDALAWVIQSAHGAEANRARDILLRDHLDSKQLGNVCQNLRYSGAADAEKNLRAILEKSPHHEVQGQACLALAQYLKDQSQRNASKEQKDKLTKEAENLFERVAKNYADVKLFGRILLGKMAKGELFEMRNLVIGKVTPEIEGEDIDGKRFKLSDYRGKVVLLDFWGNW